MAEEVLRLQMPCGRVVWILEHHRSDKRQTDFRPVFGLLDDIRQQSISTMNGQQSIPWGFISRTDLSCANFRKIRTASSPKYHGSRPFSSPAPCSLA